MCVAKRKADITGEQKIERKKHERRTEVKKEKQLQEHSLLNTDPVATCVLSG